MQREWKKLETGEEWFLKNGANPKESVLDCFKKKFAFHEEERFPLGLFVLWRGIGVFYHCHPFNMWFDFGSIRHNACRA
ncbi:hypothetical protein BLX87_18410 [Bacillus sp. VT-16-64]|nr:hypothetical protein BLX87_18410 [Bacillus sp. VT-16-64]